MYQKLKIYTLPIDKKQGVPELCITKTLYKGNHQYAIINTLLEDTNWVAHHLYLTSDEEAKQGDWYIVRDTNELKQAPGDKSDYMKPYYRKIVATTNRELYLCRDAEHEEKCDCIKVAKAPISLIEHFVKQQGAVKEVLVEYEPSLKYLDEWKEDEEGRIYKTIEEERLKLTPSGEIQWKPVEQRMYTREEVLEILNERWNHVHIDPSPLSIWEWFEKYY